jgi:serine/threonine-protein kinase
MNPAETAVWDSDERQRRLEEVLAGYLRAADAGRPPNPETLIAGHPDLADDLRAFLANRGAIARLTAPIRPPPERLGDYEILRELGRGGMGVVYQARQTRLNREVALKVILSGPLAAPAAVARFLREAEAAGNLDHPNIVPVYEVGEHQGQLFFSMKLVEGGSLADWLARHRGRLAEHQRQMAQLVATVARAVHFAHQRGILHRDLKPANILLNAERGTRNAELPEPSGTTASPLRAPRSAFRVPMVTDFGLAKRLGQDADLTEAGLIVGTAAYMAPEQGRGDRHLTTAADVYSLGAILYECLTGQPPFKAESALETLRQGQEAAPVPPRQRDRRVSRDLETICIHCLEKEPGRRYASAEALAEDLERWLAGRPVKVRPVGPFGRTWRWGRRHPLLAAGVAALVLTVLLGLVGATAVAVAREERRQRIEKGMDEFARIKQLSGCVMEAAEDPALPRLLADGDPAALQDQMRRLHERHDGGDLAGMVSSWFVLNGQGRILAVYPDSGRVAGTDKHHRDYFQGALRHRIENGRPAIHVSLPFWSENSEQYKVALAAAVVDGRGPDAPLAGVVAASVVPTAARALDLETALVADLTFWGGVAVAPLAGFLAVAGAVGVRRLVLGRG